MKSHARMEVAWAARNCRHAGDDRRGAGRSPCGSPGGSQDPADRPLPHPPPQAEHLTLDTPVPPARVLRRQLPCQRPHLVRDGRLSWRIRVGPFLVDQAPVPGQQGPWRHDLVQAQVPGQQPCQGGDHGTVSPAWFRPGDLPAQERDLVPEHQDLHILGGVIPRQQHQPAQHPDREQAEETDEHER
jgi:hypothetical protein